MKLPYYYVDRIIETALSEDINYIDIATDYLLDESDCVTAKLIAKADGVIAGIDIALRVFKTLDADVKTEVFKNDGDTVTKGELIATITGKTTALLKGERTALNILQHMSGIATQTAKCVKLAEGTETKICETRKTLPGLRPLQKYAVTCGGGRNHRYNLSDMAMLKDNHIDAYGGIIPAVNKLREKVGHAVKIEVEVRNFDELNDALNAKADIIMLDNMDVETMKEAVKIAKGKAILEASGGITDETIAEVAKTGVDYISIGALTHSVKALDISMRI